MALTDLSLKDNAPPPFEVHAPPRQTCPLVFASPHSGTFYPPDLVASSALDPLTLRRSEDSFVDRLFAAAPDFGAPLIRGRYARVYLDVNREPFELDPAMFEDALPSHTNTTSLRVAGGLGTIARVVADGAEVYRGKLRYADAEERVHGIYYPYHRALQALLEETRAIFGYAVLVDCHSMPSIGGPMDRDDGRRRPDVVLGDRFGTTCAAGLTSLVQKLFYGLGYAVVRNTPYAGGFTTYHYGRPAEGLHAVQIELNRAIYMDEERILPSPGFERVQADMARLVAGLSGLDRTELLGI